MTVGLGPAKHGFPRPTRTLAGLLNHPAGIQPDIGSLEPVDILALTLALTVSTSRDEW